MAFSRILSAFALVAVASGAAISERASSQQFTNANGPCLTASKNQDGYPVTVHACSEAATTGAWTLSASSGQSGQIKVYGDKCLDVKGGSNTDGAEVQIWTCGNGNANQQFTFGSDGTIQWTGKGKCVDLTNGNTQDGTHVQLWDCASGNKNQNWGGAASTPSGSSGSQAISSSTNLGSFFSSGSKLGAAYPDGNGPALDSLQGIKMMYTWNADNAPSDASSKGIQFLPQLWGDKSKDSFMSISKTSNAPLYLGFNEPNEPGQSDMTVSHGIELWKEAMTPVKQAGKKVASPATSSNPNGLTWVKNFRDQCGDDCDWDFTAVHWYDTTFEKFKDYMTLWHTTFNKPVIVTEFAAQNFNGGAQPSSSDVWAFYTQAIPWLNEQDFVVGYFPYGFMQSININQNDKLMNSDGSLTSLGSWIKSNAGA